MVAHIQWQRSEWTLESSRRYDNPLQEAQLSARFTAPSGKQHRVYGFWDGGTTWRLRFAPDEVGDWLLESSSSESDDQGLHVQERFQCIAARGETGFERHGPLKVSGDGHYFEHADGKAFFFLADTCWNGPLHATTTDWEHYLHTRVEQKFTAVQWVATQWRAAPEGDSTGTKAYEGHERISLNLEFFHRLEQKHDAIIAAGLLSAPVQLWAIAGSPEDALINPGASLPEDQAILLARAMVARWGADPVIWFLPGDADYQGQHAAKWRRIGQAVFGGIDHAPVSLHPNGQQWIGNFRDEPWLDFLCYQSGHGDGDTYDRWLLEGPPASEWQTPPALPVINVEPPYENHVAYQSKQPFSAHATRKRLYWSLLVSPTAGVSYGGHGVWGWDDGSGPPTAHPNSGVPLAWREALLMPAAEQLRYLHELFTGLEWWRLRPAPELIALQPGQASSEHYVLASATDEADIAIIYAPENQVLHLNLSPIVEASSAFWFDPRNGASLPAESQVAEGQTSFSVPEGEDWLLVLQKPA